MRTCILSVRLRPGQKQKLEEEAVRRGLETSELVRGIVELHLRDVQNEVLGWYSESESVLQVARKEPLVQVTLRRRRLLQK